MPDSTSPYQLTIPPLPEHLATARLFTVSIARSLGIEEDLVADVRLATSELATLAMSSGEPIVITFDVAANPPQLSVRPISPRQTGPIAGIDPMDIVRSVFSAVRHDHPDCVTVAVVGDASE